jgi:hypothetical protein
MSFILRALRLLGMVIWAGGLIFFAFVEAPIAFHVMGTTRQFAQLIGGSTHAINHLGTTCGFVFIITSLLLWKHNTVRARRLLLAEVTLTAAMIAATAYVEMSILPAMENDRALAGGDITSVPPTNPARAEFDRLHVASEKVEGSAILLGLGVILLMAAEGSGSRAATPA